MGVPGLRQGTEGEPCVHSLRVCLWTTVSRLCNRLGMDGLDVALRESRDARLAENQRVWKQRHTRRTEDQKTRRRRRLFGLRVRHAAKLARIPKQRTET